MKKDKRERLYNLTRRNLRVHVKGLLINDVLTEEINFHKLDGMYSLCTNDEGDTFYLRADTLVTVIGPIKNK